MTLPGRHRKAAAATATRAPRWEHAAVDAALVATTLLALLFDPQLGPVTPLITIAMLPLFAWLRQERLPLVIRRCWPMLLLPCFALLSTLWSVSPAATLRYGTLYLLTAVTGMLLGGSVQRTSLLLGLFGAFAAYNLAAFLFGDFVTWGGPGGRAFAGLAGGKNRSGDIAAMGTLIAVATFGLAAAQRRRWLAAAALAALLPCCWILFHSRATGALVAGGAASACLVCWLLLAALPRKARAVLLILTAVIALAAVASQTLWRDALVEIVLRSSGKTADLTGRAAIWHVADKLIAERPSLGLGYGAFWIPGNLDAEAIWRSFGITGRQGFNFHSSYREVAVHLGYVGLILYAATAAAGISGLFVGWLLRPHPVVVLFCGWAVYVGMRQGVEVVGFAPLNISALLAFMMVAQGLSAWSVRADPIPRSGQRLRHVTA